MKGLLYKDAVTLWRTGRMLMLMLLIFAAVPMMARMGYGVAFSSLLPLLSMIQIDENCHWGRLSAMLPYSALQLVLPKYLLTWATLLLTGAITAISLSVEGFLANGSAAILQALQQAALFTASGGLLCAVIAPIFFHFGTQRGRLVIVIVVMLFTSLSVGFSTIMPDAIFAMQRLMALPWLALLATIPLNALSTYLAQKWFRVDGRA